MKFKAGDIVWCNKKGKYNYTNYHVVCKSESSLASSAAAITMSPV